MRGGELRRSFSTEALASASRWRRSWISSSRLARAAASDFFSLKILALSFSRSSLCCWMVRYCWSSSLVALRAAPRSSSSWRARLFQCSLASWRARYASWRAGRLSHWPWTSRAVEERSARVLPWSLPLSDPTPESLGLREEDPLGGEPRKLTRLLSLSEDIIFFIRERERGGNKKKKKG